MAENRAEYQAALAKVRKHGARLLPEKLLSTWDPHAQAALVEIAAAHWPSRRWRRSRTAWLPPTTSFSAATMRIC